MAFFVGASKFEGTAAVSSLTVPWASTAAGQVCALIVVISNNTAAIGTPSGWSVASSASITASTASVRVLTYPTTGAESGSLTVPLTGGTATAAAVMVALSGIDTAAPVLAVSTAPVGVSTAAGQGATLGNGQTITTTAYTLSWVATINSTTAAQTFTVPSNWPQRSLALSTTTTPYVSLSVRDNGNEQPTVSFADFTNIGAASNATWGGTVILRCATPSGCTDSISGSTYTVDSSPVATAKDALNGLIMPPTVGQLWPRGGIGSKG